MVQSCFKVTHNSEKITYYSVQRRILAHCLQLCCRLQFAQKIYYPFLDQVNLSTCKRIRMIAASLCERRRYHICNLLPFHAVQVKSCYSLYNIGMSRFSVKRLVDVTWSSCSTGADPAVGNLAYIGKKYLHKTFTPLTDSVQNTKMVAWLFLKLTS